MSIVTSLFFYQIFFHEYSRFTGQQEKEEAISLTFLYHIDLLQRYFDISWVINAESLPLHTGSNRIQTGNLWFPIASR